MSSIQNNWAAEPDIILYEGGYTLRIIYKQHDWCSCKESVRKVLNNIIATTFQEAQGYLNEDATNTNETIEILSSYQETLKRKINAAKTLEDQILELEYDPATIEAILTGSTKFGIESKGKLNLITKFIATNTRKKQTNIQTRWKQSTSTIKLPKLESQNLVVILQPGSNSTIRLPLLSTTQFH